MDAPTREVRLWSGCVGRSVATCSRPAGYGPILNRCPEYLVCPGDSSEIHYVVSKKEPSTDFSWTFYFYAIIAVDKDDRIVAVTVDKMYSSL